MFSFESIAIALKSMVLLENFDIRSHEVPTWACNMRLNLVNIKSVVLTVVFRTVINKSYVICAETKSILTSNL